MFAVQFSTPATHTNSPTSCYGGQRQTPCAYWEPISRYYIKYEKNRTKSRARPHTLKSAHMRQLQGSRRQDSSQARLRQPPHSAHAQQGGSNLVIPRRGPAITGHGRKKQPKHSTRADKPTDSLTPPAGGPQARARAAGSSPQEQNSV